jgi:NADPH-dependent 2,4-dienoyl-CoA reductase/sulfur reductase-like enzyme
VSAHYPLLVIGAGPAGLAAATTAAHRGLEVTLLDEQPAPGGQIYRSIEEAPKPRAELLGADYRRGAELVRAFRASGAQYLSETQVWSLSRRDNCGCAVGTLRQGLARLVSAQRVILAGGAMERPVPFPGWTLPGVMNAGAAQILLKSAGLVPNQGTVIAGTGPLLLLLAWQYLRAGVKVEAVLELAPQRNLWWAAPRLPSALRAGHYITRGLKYLAALRRGGVPVRYGISGLRALGGNRLEAVQYYRGGRRYEIRSASLLTHFGVVPNIHLTEAAGCRHFWDDGQQCWRPELDTWGNTSIPGIGVAGDNAAVGGALSAAHAGRLAALEAARALGRLDQDERDRQSREDRTWMLADLRIRPFLEALHRLPDSLLATPDDRTLVCRCEEVSAGEIRQAVRDGHRDPNQVKFLTRCGMGPCQGRQCAHAVAHILAVETGQPVAGQRPFRVRPPIRPLSIAELAALESIEDPA